MQDPAPILKNVFMIALGVDSIDGTILEHRINEVSSKLLKTNKNNGFKAQKKSLQISSFEHLTNISPGLATYLDYFCYNKNDTHYQLEHQRYNST